VDDLWATKSEDVGLIVRAISFQDFQPMWSWSTNVTDGQTDRQTTCDSDTALCTVVHRAVKTEWLGTGVVICVERTAGDLHIVMDSWPCTQECSWLISLHLTACYI